MASSEKMVRCLTFSKFESYNNSKVIELLYFMNTTELAKIFKALSHPKRLELYLNIVQQNETNFKAGCGCFVSDMIYSLKLGAPAISHHIKELENAGLILTERRGKYLHVIAQVQTLKDVECFFVQQRAKL